MHSGEGNGSPKYQLDPGRCPADPAEVADDYCRNLLPPEEAEVFEWHYMTCPLCAGEVAKTQQLIAALRLAQEEEPITCPPHKRVI